VSVRRATSSDAAAIARVHVRSWQAAYRGLMPDELLDGLSVADREQMWREESSGEGAAGILLVDERDGRLTGFCAVAAPSRDEDAPARTAEIGAIYVDPDAWRTGAGGALLEAALAHLEAGGWQEVTLWVLEGNRAALDFYDRFGFAADGARKLYERSGTTGIRLRRVLDADSSH
jgi:RimJ/RimL family protein N-acetyltransferase